MNPIRNSNPRPIFGTRAALTVILLLSVFSGCGPSPRPAQSPDLPQKLMPQPLEADCNRLYHVNVRGKRISWKGATPVKFAFDPRFPAEFIPFIQDAMARWNEAANATIFVDGGYRKDVSLPAIDGINTFYFADAKHPRLAAAAKPLYNDDGAIAVTRTYFSGNRIVEADIIFDGVDNSFSSSRVHLNSYDIEATALHELGHALGLAHNNGNPLSTMFFGELSFGFSFRKVDLTSQRVLQCEYEVGGSPIAENRP